MTHTPGPWEVNGYAIEAVDETDPTWSIFIASVEDIDDEYGNTDANARLIAAAPELLEACEVAKAALKSLIPGATNVSAEGDTDYELICAAIRKAKGKS